MEAKKRYKRTNYMYIPTCMCYDTYIIQMCSICYITYICVDLQEIMQDYKCQRYMCIKDDVGRTKYRNLILSEYRKRK